MQKHLNTLLIAGTTSLGLCLAAATAQAQDPGQAPGTMPESGAPEEQEPGSETGAGIGQGIQDAAMTARIKSRLLLNDSTNGLKINVDTSNKEVTLNGTVETEAEKNLAEEIARSTEGVRDVQNQLKIASSAPGGDPGAAEESGPMSPAPGPGTEAP
jgi:osmotically-inducible protein OsmY